jgi:hypothetical protein
MLIQNEFLKRWRLEKRRFFERDWRPIRGFRRRFAMASRRGHRSAMVAFKATPLSRGRGLESKQRRARLT